ncbi:hypothetical protein [uncultured Algoriphagus sp.]|uniref:hypothetical protein n=1 Tax=uncultured Algoriphagus sp. TaxID=417365 RepID=UPI0025987782|nr:hypothetical protein [uncultured Algoriphagus sp.]
MQNLQNDTLPRPLDQYFLSDSSQFQQMSGDQAYRLLIALQEEVLQLRQEQVSSTNVASQVEEAYRYRTAEVKVLEQALLALIGSRPQRDQLLEGLQPDIEERYWLIEHPNHDVPLPTLPKK